MVVKQEWIAHFRGVVLGGGVDDPLPPDVKDDFEARLAYVKFANLATAVMLGLCGTTADGRVDFAKAYAILHELIAELGPRGDALAIQWRAAVEIDGQMPAVPDPDGTFYPVVAARAYRDAGLSEAELTVLLEEVGPAVASVGEEAGVDITGMSAGWGHVMGSFHPETVGLDGSRAAPTQRAVYEAVLFDLLLDHALDGSFDVDRVREFIGSLTVLLGHEASAIGVDESIVETIIMHEVYGRFSLVEKSHLGFVRSLVISKLLGEPGVQAELALTLMRAVGIAIRMPLLLCMVPAVAGRYTAEDDDVQLVRAYFRAKLLGQPFEFAMPLHQEDLSVAYVRFQAVLFNALLDEAFARTPVDDDGEVSLWIPGSEDALDGEQYPVQFADVDAVLVDALGQPSPPVPPRRVSVIRDLLMPGLARGVDLTEEDIDSLLDHAAKNVNTMDTGRAIYGGTEA